MTPWLRTLRATGLVGALGAGAVVAPYGAEPAHGAGLPASVAVVAAPSPGPAAPGAATVPDGSGTHDGRGGQARPGRPDGHDRTERPDAGSSARPTEDSGPAGGAGRRSPKPSSSSSSSSSASAASPSASGRADPDASRGGDPPGEGRQRPGRDEERGPERDGRDENADRHRDDDGVAPEDPATAPPPGRTEAAEVSPAAPSRSPARSGTPTRAAADPVLRVLPLGSGLVLIGLGLALGLVGLRLRRG
ncbi:hypothetical protein [Streptomyces tendae]|uniref:hypothetical protein n=1 Tax=Streptomyces tendae TaxID=1932 RepID=UPI00367C7D87